MKFTRDRNAHRGIFVSLLVLGLLTDGAIAAPPTLEDFFAPDDYERVVLSPDGKHIALQANVNGVGQLAIVRTDDLQPVASFHTKRRRDVGSFWWTNNERLVFTQTFSSGWLDQPVHTGELFALNIDNTQKFAIAGWETGDVDSFFKLLHPMPNNKRQARVVKRNINRGSGIRESRPVAYALDTYKSARSATGSNLSDKRFKQKLSSPYPWGSFITDNKGEVRLAYYINNEGALKVSLRKGKRDWLELPKFSISAERMLRGLASPIVGFDAKNQGVYYLAESEHGTASLYHYDLTTEKNRVLFKSEQFDVNGYLLIRASNHEVVGVTLIGTYPENHFFSSHPEVDLLKRITASFPYQLVYFASFSSDGRYVLFETISDRDPGTLYLYDGEAGGVRPLIKARNSIDPAHMKTREPFHVKTEDGLDLYGFLTLPEAEGKNYPTVVMVHGGPHGVADSFLYHPEAQYLASRGYAVVQMNYRGSGGYGTKLLDAGVGEWAGGMIGDVALATQWAIQQGIADESRVCIYGASYGAFAAMSAAAQYPELYQCAAGVAGVYDLSALKDSDVSFLPWGRSYLNHVLGTDMEKLKQDSPVNHPEKIKVPVFLAHGGEDNRAPVSHATAMKAALERTGNAPMWLLFSDEGHGFSEEEHRYEFYEKLGGFFAQHIGQGEQ